MKINLTGLHNIFLAVSRG